MKGHLLKIKVQKIILTVSILLLIGKFLAFYLTNSVGILTDAMESIVNVVAGIISLMSLYVSSKPKDEGHPFGHGKIEQISASIEGLMIMLAGGMIIYEGAKRIFFPTMIEKLDIGIYIVAGAGLINYILGYYSIRVGRKHDSMALIAGGKHLQSDTYSSIGLVLGLCLLYFTKIAWIDSALALTFGGIILFTGAGILQRTIANLMDKADKEILTKIHEVIVANRRSDWMDIHNLKMIKNGSMHYIECDLTLPWYYNIRQSHEACDYLESVFEKEFPESIQLSVHSDPCKPFQCKNCVVEKCQHRTEVFTEKLDLTLDILINESDKSKYFANQTYPV